MTEREIQVNAIMNVIRKILIENQLSLIVTNDKLLLLRDYQTNKDYYLTNGEILDDERRN